MSDELLRTAAHAIKNYATMTANDLSVSEAQVLSSLLQKHRQIEQELHALPEV